MTDTTTSSGPSDRGAGGGGGRTALTVIAWLWVVIPFLYGVYSLTVKVPALF